jgi:ABC-type transport system substrate-binding protein
MGDPYMDSLRALFRRAEFRRALSKAMNRQDLVDNVFLQFAAPLYQLSGLGKFDISGGPGSTGEPDPDFPHAFLEHDPVAANALLDGLDLPRNRDGVRTFGNSYPAAGQRVLIELKTNQENANRILISDRLADTYLSTLGLAFSLTRVPFDQAIDELLTFQFSDRQAFGTWQAFVIGIGGGSDASEALSPVTSNGFLHFYRYSDYFPESRSAAQQRLDDLWAAQEAIAAEAGTEMVGGLPGYVFRSPAERFELIREMQLLGAELQDSIFTVVEKPIFAYYADRLGNVSNMTINLDSDYKSILNFFERGFRIRSKPGGKPGITPSPL